MYLQDAARMQCTHLTEFEGGFENHCRIIYPTLRKVRNFPSSISRRSKGWLFRPGLRGLSKGDSSMVRHLTTLILGGILGSMVLVGNAEACHKTKCRHAAPVVCATPVVCTTQSSARPRPGICVQARGLLQAALRPVHPRSSAASLPCPRSACPSSATRRRAPPAPVVVACATPVYAAARGMRLLPGGVATGVGTALSCFPRLFPRRFLTLAA